MEQRGIYRIRNLQNGNFYIGSTAGKFCRRWSGHRCDLRKNRHGNGHLQRSWNKYGEHSFVFEVLELVPDKDYLAQREQFWLDQSVGDSNCYNIAREASRPPRWDDLSEEVRQRQVERIKLLNTGRKHSVETRQRMSMAQKGRVISDEHRKRISEQLRGQKLSKEHRVSLSEAKLGRNLTDDHKAAIARSNWRRKKWPPLKSPSGEVFEGESICSLAAKHGLNKSMLLRVAKGIQAEHKGWSIYKKSDSC